VVMPAAAFVWRHRREAVEIRVERAVERLEQPLRAERSAKRGRCPYAFWRFLDAICSSFGVL